MPFKAFEEKKNSNSSIICLKMINVLFFVLCSNFSVSTAAFIASEFKAVARTRIIKWMTLSNTWHAIIYKRVYAILHKVEKLTRFRSHSINFYALSSQYQISTRFFDRFYFSFSLFRATVLDLEFPLKMCRKWRCWK